MAERNPLTLTRTELYDLVWSKPMTAVAKELGLSDVAVGKRCRAVQVPVPPRGYWAQVASGLTPRRPPLPKYRVLTAGTASTSRHSLLPTQSPPPAPEPTVTFQPPLPKPAPDTQVDDAMLALGERLKERLRQLRVTADAPLTWTFSLAATTAEARVPPGWPTSLRSASRLPVIRTHGRAGDLRARGIATQLITIATRLGWAFNPTSGEPRRYDSPEEAARRQPHFVVEDELLFVEITERQRRIERPLTVDEQRERKRHPDQFHYRDRYRYEPTGELTLVVFRGVKRHQTATFKDLPRRPLETRVSEILIALMTGAARNRLAREHERQALIERRDREEQAYAVQKTREAHEKIIRHLEAEAGAWERVRRLRRYLRAARKALPPGTTCSVEIDGELNDAFALGDEFANQLDPLSAVPRDQRFARPPHALGYSSLATDDSVVRDMVRRVLGQDWLNTQKYLDEHP
jgi:hypothetical protein